jgi:DMSO/TMAO reductase YedYZ molybdopterin-dependent catalytic subunit
MMKKLDPIRGILLGCLIGGALAGITYLGQRIAGLPFIPFDIFDWLARVLPGRIVVFTIETMVGIIRKFNLGPTASTAKFVEQGIALVQFVVTWAVFGLILGLIARRRPQRVPMLGLLGGSLLFISTAGIEAARGFPEAGPPLALAWLAVVLLGGGLLLGRAVSAAPVRADVSPEEVASRRRFLYLVGLGSFTVMATAAGVSLFSKKGKKALPAVEQEEIARAAKTSGPAASPSSRELEARFPPISGTRPELTKNEDFYRIDINLQPPKVDGEAWRLRVEGLVERPLSLSLQDIRSRPSQTQAITLSCISNPVGGDLISSSFWTGVPLVRILEEAGLKEGVREIFIESVDGFYESVPLAEAMDGRTLLVTEMNGEPLPVGHGFPLRIFIPGHFGMKQPKWIKRLEAIDRHGPGYWVDRNWSATALVQTTSVIDTAAAAPDASGKDIVPVGGIAYAGARGISAVEVQVDDGSWQKAELRLPPLGPLTWVQWRYFWTSTRGRHTFRVRAYDGTGNLQEAAEHAPYPNGATGIHERTAEIG